MKINSSKLALVSLIGSNLLTAFLVLYFRWSLFDITFVYWLENLAIGIFTYLKLNKIKRSQGKFFLLHYGMFTFVHLVFLFVFIWPSARNIEQTFSLSYLLWIAIIPFAGMLISHGISYVTNFLGREEYKKKNAGSVMFLPYPRIFLMQFAIIVGGMILEIAGQLHYLILFIGMKIIVDIIMHLIEHSD